MAKDTLEERGKLLVQAADIWAVGSLLDVTKQFPVLRDISSDDWDFFATVAGVFVGVNRLIGRIPNERFKQLFANVIDPEVNRWNRDGSRALEDCNQFVGQARTQMDSGELTASDLLGQWLVLNLLQPPEVTRDMANTMRQVGGFVATPFADWWTDCPEFVQTP